MGKRKIQNESEVIRWFEEGRTYQWMIDEYRRKYNIETVQSMWGNFRRRHGLDKRIVRDNELIPWPVKVEHRWAYPLAMLRTEARRRANKTLTETDQSRLASWLEMLRENDAVVHYDPDTEEGFFYIPREAGDDDIIRPPAAKAATQPKADTP
ncbi:hypothetical protein [Streptomyces sp. NPDC051546]|uniref:hypothetical protein n=1 Tax=Streptomyces sp. NPDC051546 TaxID=3365655 RepID=UPI0037B11CE2